MPDIAETTGWRDGALALGTLGPSPSTTAADVSPSEATLPEVVSYAFSDRYDYSGGAVTSAAWTQIVAATAAEAFYVTIFDSSGYPMYLGLGAAGSEQITILIPPGGIPGQLRLNIPAGTRLSLKAVSTTASVGEFNITGYT